MIKLTLFAIFIENKSYLTGLVTNTIIITKDGLVGLMVAITLAELEVMGSIPWSGWVLFGFSFRHCSVADKESEFLPGS